MFNFICSFYRFFMFIIQIHLLVLKYLLITDTDVDEETFFSPIQSERFILSTVSIINYLNV